MLVSRIAALFVGSVFSAIVVASPTAANICDAAAHRASATTGVPVDVLLTITRLETGRSDAAGDPWPWTVNHADNGTWFSSEDDARSYVFAKVKRGVSNIDIGCFQINYRWHADAFRSLDEMFNPEKNAEYAAHFLNMLYREFGDWTEAAGAYHSRTPRYAERYKSKFHQISARLASLDRPSDPSRNSEPSVIHGRSPVGGGSLFVIETGHRRPLIDLRRAKR